MRRTPWLVPGRIVVTPTMVMMRHPRPMMVGHDLVVSRGGILDLTQDEGAEEFWDAVEESSSGQELARVLVTNIGDRQEVRLLHVHLLLETPSWALGVPVTSAERLSTLAQSVRQEWALIWWGRTGSVAFRHEDGQWHAHVDLAP